MKQERVGFQLTPVGIQRHNNIERSIKNFKNPFIVVICATLLNYSLHLWDKLLHHAILTLTILRLVCINLKLSAQARVHGALNYQITPIASSGINVLAHVRLEGRKSWDV